MNWNDAQNRWHALEEAVIARWPDLDRDEVSAIDGDRQRFNAYLGRVYGVSPREADEQIAEWLAGPFPSDGAMSETLDNARIRDSGAHIPPGEDVYSEDADFGDDRIAERPLARSA